MPPAISEDESSGSEAGDIPFTKGQGKGKGKSAVEKQLIEEAVQDGEEEENEEMQEEEYIVEKILSHGFDIDGTLKFEVQWAGYEEKTWEPEDNLQGCPDELQTYYKEIGGKPRFNPVAQDGSTPSSKAPTKKRKLSETAAATPPVSANKGGKGKKKSRLEVNASALKSKSNNAEQPDAVWQPPSGSWEEHIIQIDTMERGSAEEGGKLFAYVVWNTMARSRHAAEVVYAKCPQKTLLFYEAHLHFESRKMPEEANGKTHDEDAGQEEIKPVASAMAT